jgi:predicted nucleotidyltransferase component of viral defense system
MLSVNDIAAWSITHPWVSADQVEQDFLLSRAICAIASHNYLGGELVFRGGTALHKLHLPQPLRYSEDLDYVRTSAGGISQLTGALLDLGRDLSFDVRSRITEHPKVYWRTRRQRTHQTGCGRSISSGTQTRTAARLRRPRLFQEWAYSSSSAWLPERVRVKVRIWSSSL